MTKKQICELIIQSIKDFMSTPSRLDAYKAKNRFVRERLLSIIHVIMYLLFSNSASMATNLANIKRELCSITDFPKKITKQAISYARQGINPTLFMDLFNISVDAFYPNLPKRKTWHGHHVFAIDGSKLELPNSQKNYDTFGEMFSVFDHDKKYSQALASIVYDVLDDYIIHASINRYLASERATAIEHLKILEELNIYNNSVVIFDRGYYSENMFRYCVEHNHLCVMRLKSNTLFCKDIGDTTADITDVLSGKPKKGTSDIPIRIISVKLSSGEYEYLATNIFDKSITPELFRELYFLRWPVEVKYYELKERLQIENFNGATPISIVQEFYMGLLLSNISALIKDSADGVIKANSKPTNKYRYQANRSFIIGQMKLMLPKIIFNLAPLTALDDVFEDACMVKSQVLPGRKFKRKKRKDNQRTHFRNKKPCF